MEFDRWPFWRRWLGERSEKYAARYLRRLGWRIVGANIKDSAGELDLLALDQLTLVAVEVRSVVGDDPARPASSVNFTKQRKITDAMVRFISRRRLLDINVRFDVIGMAWPPGSSKPNILHIRNAFQSHHKFQLYY